MKYTIDEYENTELDEKADDIQWNDSDSSVLTAYLKEISKYPVLSREQETALFKRLSEGNEDAREALINSNLKLVVSIIKNYIHIPSDMDMMDIIQEGNMGLIRAIGEFDYTLGNKFSTYATWWIRQSAMRGIHDKGNAIRIPVHYQERQYQIYKAKLDLTKKTHREPTLEEISAETSIPLQLVKDSEANNKLRIVGSLDIPLDPEKDDPKIIQREEDLVMAMQVATGKNTFNDTSDNFQKKNIIVTEASKEKRERVLELLTPDLRLKVLNIYRVIPKEQEKKFKQYVKDRNISEIKSLWHGSRNENWLSIAENGLMLHPNAAITGKMFGNGIYFASSAKKSWGYTSGGFWTREMSSSTRFMGLYATAYGNPLNVTSPSNYSEKSIGNFNCVHAHAGNYLRNDEIIFYNEAAMLLTYLVEFSA